MGNGKIDALGHQISTIPTKEPTCKEDGCKAYYKCDRCSKYFSDAEATNEITNLEEWKNGNGKIPALGHTISKISSKAATCTEDGYKDYFTCIKCKKYFKEAEAINEITNVLEWKSNEGKIPALGHTMIKIDGVAPTYETDGYKDAYKCTRCNTYFEDEAATKVINDYETWKNNEGKLPKLNPQPEKKGLSTGCIIGIAIGGFLLLLLLIYIIGFIIYKKSYKALKIVKPSYRWINKHIFKSTEEDNQN